jgi:hypothetical protein
MSDCLSWTITGKPVSINLNYIFLKRDEKVKPHLTFQILVESKANGSMWWEMVEHESSPELLRVFYITLLCESLSLAVDCYLIFSLSYLNVWIYHCETIYVRWSLWVILMFYYVSRSLLLISRVDAYYRLNESK